MRVWGGGRGKRGGKGRVAVDELQKGSTGGGR